MTELAPGWTLHEEESTENHWVGACGDVVLVFAYEGSHDDPRHVHAAARLIERLGRQRGPLKLLFVLPPAHAKPPDARVRGAIARVAPRLRPFVGRAAVVVSGTGFGAALHRGAIAGVLTLLRAMVPVKVVGTLREGLGLLVDPASRVFQPLLLCCEHRSVPR